MVCDKLDLSKTCCQKTQYIHWARITTFLEFNILSSLANLSLNAFRFFIHSSTDNCSTWFSKIVMIMQFKILWQKYNIWFAVCSVTWASHFCPCIFSCSCILVAFARYLPQAMETTNSLDKFLVCHKTHWCVKTCGYWNLIGWMHCLQLQDRNRFYLALQHITFTCHVWTVFIKWRTYATLVFTSLCEPALKVTFIVSIIISVYLTSLWSCSHLQYIRCLVQTSSFHCLNFSCFFAFLYW